jgi:hypothetical protein
MVNGRDTGQDWTGPVWPKDVEWRGIGAPDVPLIIEADI